MLHVYSYEVKGLGLKVHLGFTCIIKLVCIQFTSRTRAYLCAHMCVYGYIYIYMYISGFRFKALNM